MACYHACGAAGAPEDDPLGEALLGEGQPLGQLVRVPVVHGVATACICQPCSKNKKTSEGSSGWQRAQEASGRVCPAKGVGANVNGVEGGLGPGNGGSRTGEGHDRDARGAKRNKHRRAVLRCQIAAVSQMAAGMLSLSVSTGARQCNNGMLYFSVAEAADGGCGAARNASTLAWSIWATWLLGGAPIHSLLSPRRAPRRGPARLHLRIARARFHSPRPPPPWMRPLFCK